MRLGYYLGRATKGVAKATLPVAKWATQTASTFALEFGRGMTEQPKVIGTGEQTDENYKNAVRDETNNEVPSEPVQPELPGMNPEQPARQS
tara:strand:+ start:472 stop:744 length:273 start_codon:yes stop_codon:yes gene_type:complete